jgi:DNA-binding MarR family transcriptional regulator
MNPATTLVTSVADVVELLTDESSDSGFDQRDSDIVVRILDSLSTTQPRIVNDIAAKAGIDVATVTSALGSLEAQCRVDRSGNLWRRI